MRIGGVNSLPFRLTFNSSNMRTNFKVYVVYLSIGGMWLYTDRREAETTFDCVVKQEANSLKEQGRKIELKTSDFSNSFMLSKETWIIDANDGLIIQTINVREPMNGQSIQLFSNKDIEFKAFHTSCGPAIEIKSA